MCLVGAKIIVQQGLILQITDSNSHRLMHEMWVVNPLRMGHLLILTNGICPQPQLSRLMEIARHQLVQPGAEMQAPNLLDRSLFLKKIVARVTTILRSMKIVGQTLLKI
jgi:hypothetical protein